MIPEYQPLTWILVISVCSHPLPLDYILVTTHHSFAPGPTSWPIDPWSLEKGQPRVSGRKSMNTYCNRNPIHWGISLSCSHVEPALYIGEPWSDCQGLAIPVWWWSTSPDFYLPMWVYTPHIRLSGLTCSVVLCSTINQLLAHTKSTTGYPIQCSWRVNNGPVDTLTAICFLFL